MNYEEAIEEILWVEQYGFIPDNSIMGTSRIKSAFQVAIEALKMRMPKKPVGDLHSVPHHRCPNCKKAIRIYVDAPYNPFCCFCGQAIDWSAKVLHDIEH